jgi:hypothetical protein
MMWTSNSGAAFRRQSVGRVRARQLAGHRARACPGVSPASGRVSRDEPGDGRGAPCLGRATRRPDTSLQAELDDYWQTFDPLFDWTPAEKIFRSASFLRREVVPRREAALAIRRSRSITEEYDFALGYSLHVMPRDQLLRSLTPLYTGWLASFVLHLWSASLTEIEERVERVCMGFESEKRYLISRWRCRSGFADGKRRSDQAIRGAAIWVQVDRILRQATTQIADTSRIFCPVCWSR